MRRIDSLPSLKRMPKRLKRELDSEINFEKVLREKREIVWSEIKNYLQHSLFPIIKSYSKGYSKIANFHKKLVFEYPERRGKYVRPTLLLLTCEAMGCSQEKAIKTAAAMQISEDWILVHDDLEDGSLMRRGEPTLHRLFSSELAVNAGDALHVLMWKVLYDNIDVLNVKITTKLINEFYQMLTRTTLGQTTEIKWTQDNKLDLKDEDWFFIAEGKTAYYTIAGPMRLGAIIAGATKRQLDLIFEFGTYLGRCFQIRDDILDLTSDFRGYKKQQGNDVFEGKRTLILCHLARNASSSDLKKLNAFLRKPRDKKTQKEARLVIDLMHKYGSINYSQRVAEKQAREATDIFENEFKFLSHEPSRTQLRAGINFILQRDY